MNSFIDFHNHCLPSFDDGSKSIDESLAMLRQAVASNITLIYVTPHSIPDSIFDPSLEEIRAKIEIIESLICEHQLPIQVKYGSELRVNEHTLERIYDKNYIPYEDTDYVLLELTHQNIHSNVVNDIIDELHYQQKKVLIAHPERYFLDKDEALQHCQKWLKQGVYLQINRTSLLKDHHPQEREVAQALFNNALVHIIASDAHSAQNRRILRLDDIYDQVCKTHGMDYADQILINNPVRLSLNEALLRPVLSQKRPIRSLFAFFNNKT